MRQFAVVILAALGFASNAAAQSFTDDLRAKKQGQGTLTIIQSGEIDELVDNANLNPAKPQDNVRQGATKPAAPVRKPSADTPPTAAKQRDAAPADRNATADADRAEPDMSKKVIREGRKITGYRVQVYSGGNSRADRQKAQNIGNSIKSKYPDLPIYVHFYSPRWICRVGNFRTYEEADEVLKDLRGMGYSEACIVKGRITVGN